MKMYLVYDNLPRSGISWKSTTCYLTIEDAIVEFYARYKKDSRYPRITFDQYINDYRHIAIKQITDVKGEARVLTSKSIREIVEHMRNSGYSWLQ
jgi:hypothetical protein